MSDQPVLARVWAAAAACLSILIGMLVLHAWPLWAGQSIYLRVTPVDPRDLFRGQYVTLGYAIDTLHVGAEAAVTCPTCAEVDAWGELAEYSDDIWKLRDRVVYVQLTAEEASDGLPPTVRAISVGLKPKAGAVNLKGRVAWAQVPHRPLQESAGSAAADASDSLRVVLRVRYGLDAYFVQEGRGPLIEGALRSGKPVHAEVALTSGGRARIRDLIVEGQPFAVWRRGQQPSAVR